MTRSKYLSLLAAVALVLAGLVLVVLQTGPEPAPSGPPVRKAVGDVTIVVAGDIGGSHTGAQASGDLVRSIAPTRVFGAGDIAYPDGTAGDYASEYTPYWGSFLSITDASPGNHDMHTCPPYFFDYFYSGVNNMTTWMHARNVGGWRIYMLDIPTGSDCPASTPSVGVGSAFEAALAADLAAHPGMPCGAITHGPRFTSGTQHGDTNFPAIWADLQNAGCDFVVSGHNHQMEQFQRMTSTGSVSSAGMRQFVSGSGGDSSHYPFTSTPHTGSEFRNNYDVGVLKMTLSSNSFSWQWVAAGLCFNPPSGPQGSCHNTMGTVIGSGSDVSHNSTSPPVNYTLTAAKNGTGTGIVASSPAGIDCGSTCSASFLDGTPVTLLAPPIAGSTFTGWSGGGCSGTGACVTTMSSNRTVTATFTLNTGNQALTVTKAGGGTGSVTSSPSGITCGATCSANFAINTSVTLTAAPDANYTFGGWSGACTGGLTTCTVSMSASRSVTATFNAPNPQPSVTEKCDPNIPAMVSYTGPQVAQVRPGVIRHIDAAGNTVRGQVIAHDQRPALGQGPAIWTSQILYPITFGTVPGSCWSGGALIGTWPAGTPWSTFHGTGGINLRDAPGGIVVGTTIGNYGDSFRVEGNSPGFLFQRVHAIASHDDCFEDDNNWGGEIRDSFFESCYSGISMASAFNPAIHSGAERTLTINRSIIRMEPMDSVYSGTAPGHGAWFKVDMPTAPRLRLVNTILVAGLYPTNHQNYNPPPNLKHCEGVVIIWTGDASARHPLLFPATAAWQAACPSVRIIDNSPGLAETAYQDYKARWENGTYW